MRNNDGWYSCRCGFVCLDLAVGKYAKCGWCGWMLDAVVEVLPRTRAKAVRKADG